MRETKFRAWNKKKKLMKNVTSLVDIYHCSARAEVDKHTLEEWDFDNIELMQYTGLKDKNGKEIWEGDIVKCKLSSTQRYRGIVEFKKGSYFIQSFWYSFKPIGRWDLEKRKLCGVSTTKLSMNVDEIEVIGNIYENPELLEKKNEGIKKIQLWYTTKIITK